MLIHLLGAVVSWTGLWVHISSQPDPAKEGLKQRGDRGRGKEVLVHDALRGALRRVRIAVGFSQLSGAF